VRITIYITADEEDVVKDFDTAWDEPHLSRIGIQGARRRKER